MPFDSEVIPPVICLTVDHPELSHVEQARRLCAAGARWVQLRMKNASADHWLATARDVVALCHHEGALCTINDNVDIALASGADGVHLGSLDESWLSARERLGPDHLLGGTINNASDARRAADATVLDYVGIGPLRFTATKQNLAPVLGLDGIAALLPLLQGLPAWAIGGVLPSDLPALRQAGLAGVAVSSSLLHTPDHHAAYVAAWSQKS